MNSIPHRSYVVFQLLIVTLALASKCYVLAANGPWQLISARSTIGVTSRSAGGNSGGAVFSRDGRFVALVSSADNLVTNCQNGATTDVFVRELDSGRVTLVSVSTNGWNGGNGHSSTPVISEDGRFVAFISAATDLVARGEGASEQVFIRDLLEGTTELVSVALDGNSGGNGISGSPSMSADGRKILFESLASNLVENDLNGQRDVFLRDVAAGETLLVSSDASGKNSGLGGHSFNAQMDSDASISVFQSLSTNLITVELPKVQTDLYLRRMDLGVTERLRLSEPNFPVNGLVTTAFALSRNGRYLVATFRGPRSLYRIDLQSAQSTPITLVGSPIPPMDVSQFTPINATLSDDGETVAFEAATFSMTSLIGVWTASSGLQWLKYPETPAAPALDVWSPLLSPDGARLVFFRSTTNAATDSIGPLPTWRSDLYSCTLSNGAIELLFAEPLSSRTPEHQALSPVFSPNGRSLAFETASPTVVSDDHNNAADLFLRDLETGDTELLSTADSTRLSRAAAANSRLPFNPLSADGRVLVLTGMADDLIPNDHNGKEDVFAHNFDAGTNTLVSVATNGSSGNGGSRWPAISGNGRFVAFVSEATDLVPGGTSGENVFLRDLLEGTTELLTEPGIGIATRLPAGFGPTISADGRRVAWVSSSASRSIYTLVVLDVTTRAMETLSASYLVNPTLSADGQKVSFFTSENWSSMRGNPQVLDVNSGQTRELFYQDPIFPKVSPGNFCMNGDGSQFLAAYAITSRSKAYWMKESETERELDIEWNGETLTDVNVTTPRISAGGDFAVVVVSKTPGLGPADLPESSIFWFDLRAGICKLVTLRSDNSAAANGPSSDPAISADGRYVLFRSTATDLTPDVPFTGAALFLRDMQTGVTRRIGPTSALVGNGYRGQAYLSANAGSIAVASDSAILTGDYNLSLDVLGFRNESPAPELPQIFPVQMNGRSLVLSWKGGILQVATGLEGPWTDLQEATSPYTHPVDLRATTFFRVKGSESAPVGQ